MFSVFTTATGYVDHHSITITENTRNTMFFLPCARKIHRRRAPPCFFVSAEFPLTTPQRRTFHKFGFFFCGIFFPCILRHFLFHAFSLSFDLRVRLSKESCLYEIIKSIMVPRQYHVPVSRNFTELSMALSRAEITARNVPVSDPI